MTHTIRRVHYFRTTVRDRPGEAFKLLAQLAAEKVNLLAFAVVPAGLEHAQLTLFPEKIAQLAAAAESAGLTLEGPHPAILVQGDDTLGALAEVHSRLYDATINVFSSSGVTDGKGAYGYNKFVDNGSNENDRRLTAEITEDVGRFINGEGEVTFLVYNDEPNLNTFHDYMCLTVKSTATISH